MSGIVNVNRFTTRIKLYMVSPESECNDTETEIKIMSFICLPVFCTFKCKRLEFHF